MNTMFPSMPALQNGPAVGQPKTDSGTNSTADNPFLTLLAGLGVLPPRGQAAAAAVVEGGSAASAQGGLNSKKDSREKIARVQAAGSLDLLIAMAAAAVPAVQSAAVPQNSTGENSPDKENQPAVTEISAPAAAGTRPALMPVVAPAVAAAPVIETAMTPEPSSTAKNITEAAQTFRAAAPAVPADIIRKTVEQPAVHAADELPLRSGAMTPEPSSTAKNITETAQTFRAAAPAVPAGIIRKAMEQPAAHAAEVLPPAAEGDMPQVNSVSAKDAQEVPHPIPAEVSSASSNLVSATTERSLAFTADALPLPSADREARQALPVSAKEAAAVPQARRAEDGAPVADGVRTPAEKPFVFASAVPAPAVSEKKTPTEPAAPVNKTTPAAGNPASRQVSPAAQDMAAHPASGSSVPEKTTPAAAVTVQTVKAEADPELSSAPLLPASVHDKAAASKASGGADPESEGLVAETVAGPAVAVKAAVVEAAVVALKTDGEPMPQGNVEKKGRSEAAEHKNISGTSGAAVIADGRVAGVADPVRAENGLKLHEAAEAPRMIKVQDQLFQVTRVNARRLEISVQPEGLGKIDIEVNLSSGQIHARINASDSQTRNMLEQKLPDIMNALAADGHAIGGLSIGLRDSREQTQQESSGQRRTGERKVAAADPLPVRSAGNNIVSIFV